MTEVYKIPYEADGNDDHDDDSSNALTDLDSCAIDDDGYRQGVGIQMEYDNSFCSLDISEGGLPVEEDDSSRKEQQPLSKKSLPEIPYEYDTPTSHGYASALSNKQEKTAASWGGTGNEAASQDDLSLDTEHDCSSSSNTSGADLEARHHQFLFEIPYECDDGLTKESAHANRYATMKDLHQRGEIPYEYDTVTVATASESFTQIGDYNDVEEDNLDTSNHDNSSLPAVEEQDPASVALKKSLIGGGDGKANDKTKNKSLEDVFALMLDTIKEVEEETRMEDAFATMVETIKEVEEETTEEVDETMSPCDGSGNLSVAALEVEEAEVAGTDTHDEEEQHVQNFRGMGLWLPGFTVWTEIRRTTYLGENQYGIVTMQDIPAGKRVWEWTEELTTFHHEDMEAYIEKNFYEDDLEDIRKFLRRGVVLRGPSDSHFVSAMNDSIGFMNCSSSPNVRHYRATREILKGEELTLDYSFYGNPQWYVDLCHKYGIMTGAEIAERQVKLGPDSYLSADSEDWLGQYVSAIR